MDYFGIVILNYNTYKDTIQLLVNLDRQNLENFTVVIVDNNSSNDSVLKIDDYLMKSNHRFKIRFLKNKQNNGYSYGNNIGLEYLWRLKIKYAFIMNNDIVINNEFFLKNMLNRMLEMERVVFLGPNIIQNNKSELPLFPNRPSFSSQIIENLIYPLTIIWNKFKRKYLKQNEKFVYGISGCCFLINLDLFKKIDFFDDGMFLYGEEAVIAEKAYNNLLKVYYYPKEEIIHNHSKTIKNHYKNQEILKMQIKNKVYYYEKYRNDLSKNQKRLIYLSFKVYYKYNVLLQIIKKR